MRWRLPYVCTALLLTGCGGYTYVQVEDEGGDLAPVSDLDVIGDLDVPGDALPGDGGVDGDGDELLGDVDASDADVDEGDGDGAGDFGDNPFMGDDAGDGAATDEGPICDPAAPEVCNGVDDDCDTEVDEGVTNPCGHCLPYPFCSTGAPPYCSGNDCIGSGEGTSGEGNLPPPNETDGTILIDVDPADGYGSITLATGSVSTDFAWPASESNGTVSRVDTVNRREVGRYAAVLVRDGAAGDVRNPYVARYDHTPTVPPRTACAEPSRSTVDELGNAYIANRAVADYSGRCDSENVAPNQMGSITKVGYYNALLCDGDRNPGLAGCQCVDRNGDGVIQTSRDYDEPPNGIQPSTCPGDCASVTLGACTGSKCQEACTTSAACGAGHYCVYDKGATPLAGVDHKWRCSTSRTLPEFLGEHDECLLWTRRVPGRDHDGNLINDGNRDSGDWRAAPRAMAIDKHGYVWVGAYFPQRAYKLSPSGEYVYPRDPNGDGPPAVNDVCPATLRYVSDGSPVPEESRQDCLTQECYETIPDGCWIELGINPYGAVIDSGRQHPNRAGYLWMSPYGGEVRRVDTETGLISVPPTSGLAYGVTIDHADRLWTADPDPGATPRVRRLTPGAPIATSTWDAYNPSYCVGAYCDIACTDDSACAGNPAGHRRCSADLGNGARACTTECADTRDCAPHWGAVCVAGVCTWDADDQGADVTEWHGRGATTELISRESECAAQGAPGAPCSRVWVMFHNAQWNQGDGNAPNWLFAFDADTGREIVALRRRMDVDADSFTPDNRPPGVNGVANLCSGGIGVGIGLGGLVWSSNYGDDSACAYDSLSPDRIISVAVDLNPYTYSDFTGNIFRSFTNPQGKYRVLVKACQDPLVLDTWGSLIWTADKPAQATLEVRLRFGATLGEASDPTAPQDTLVLSAAGTDVQNTVALPAGETRGWLEVELNFIAGDDGSRPVLDAVSVLRSCKQDE